MPISTTRIIHLGDLHFWRIPYNPVRYLSKRLLGVGNLVVGGRARKFRQDLLPKLAVRVGEVGCDWLLMSGDVSSTALPAEFRAARNLIEPLTPRIRAGVRIVPGNHDCYLGKAAEADEFARQLGPALGPVKLVQAEVIEERVLLLCINATTNNGMGSHGALTELHLPALRSALETHRSAPRIVILCHFPHEHPDGILHRDRGAQLLGGERLLPMLAEDGRPALWLHGHHHHRWIFRSPTAPNLVYLNGGAPAMRRGGALPDLGFHEIDFADGFAIKTHRFDHSALAWTEREVALPEVGKHEELNSW
jgi:calcineurin-like phosphoesterase family protein